VTVWTADPEKREEDEEEDIRLSKRKFSKLICQFINLFGELGGFEAWVRAFTYINEDPKDLTNITLPPYKMMKDLIGNLQTTYAYLNKDFVNKIMPSIKAAIVRRLKYLNDKEIKDLDRDMISKFIIKAQGLLANTLSREEIYALTETSELEIALRFLTCPYLEKRLRGINEIKEMAEKIDLYEQTSSFSKMVHKATKHLSAKEFIDWIFKNKVFELILGDSMHIEIIKRTHDILKFIAKYETIPIHLIDLLWNSCEGKHEATLLAMYDLIIQISYHLNDEGIHRLKQKIESIPDEEQNEMTLNLIKGFAINTLPSYEEIRKERESKQVDESKYHCVDVLWRLMLDDNKLSPQLAESSLNALAAVLKEPNSRMLRLLYIEKCMNNIKTGTSVAQSINLLYSILTSCYTYHRFDHETSLGHILEFLNMRYHLNDLLVDEFVKFQTKMAELVKTAPQAPIEADREKIFVGKYNYQTNFHNRLVFIEYLWTNPSYEFNPQVNHFEKLWDCLVLNPIWQADKEYFYTWIGRKPESNRISDLNPLVPSSILPEFFEKILSNPEKLDNVNLSPEGFDCFTFYFKLINELQKNFKTNRNGKLVVVDLEYAGKDTLWTLFLNCKNEKTTEKIVGLLVECVMSLSSDLEEKKKDIWENFVLKCINLLKEGASKPNDKLITKAVLLLMSFFDRFEGKSKFEARPQGSRGFQVTLNIIMRPENTHKTVSMGLSQPLGVLRQKIGEAFGLETHEFRLYSKGTPIEPEEDEGPWQQYAYSGPFIIQKIESKKDTSLSAYHPKKIIAENSEYVDLLFKMLSEDIPGILDFLSVNF